MSDRNLTDRLRERAYLPLDIEAADEIDRLRATIAGFKQWVGELNDTVDQRDATIAALLAGTTNCARNLRNLGEAHADGDDPIIDVIILDSGVISEAPMSSLFLAAADALDALAVVVEGET